MEPVSVTDMVPYIKASAVPKLRTAFRRLHATALALADPPQVIRVERSTQSGWAVQYDIEVVVAMDNQAPRVLRGGDGTETIVLTGTVEAWTPWDVRQGDQFTLDGQTATITNVYPIRSGVQRAAFQIGAGGAVT